jgi:hypothetical protein
MTDAQFDREAGGASCGWVKHAGQGQFAATFLRSIPLKLDATRT